MIVAQVDPSQTLGSVSGYLSVALSIVIDPNRIVTMLSLVTPAPVPPTLGLGMSAMTRPAPRRALHMRPRASVCSPEVFQIAEQVATKVGDVSAPGASA